ncbi:MAG: hypothetical protein L0J45_04985 [Psychroflexus sp.]|nr:hypothetical protein [Psychroflexus sp.]MDN6310045.1 hypothetical protein [Psychroflexus sp.]
MNHFNKILFFVFLNCFFAQEQLAQSLALEFQQSRVFEAEIFHGVDDFGAFYFSSDGVLYKQTAQEKNSFQDFHLGEISHVDLLNPLRISVFYKNANTVVLLDNRLNEINRIDFSSLKDPISAEYASTSRKNQLWVIDALSRSLLNFDIKDLKIISKSLPLSTPYISFTSDYNTFIYSKLHALQTYSTYATFIKAIPAMPIGQIQLNQGRVLYQSDQDLVLINIKTADEIKLKVPDILVQDFHLNGENLYLYDGKEIHFFKILD